MAGSHHLAHTYGSPRQWTEQDGVINRLLIEQEGVSLLPRCPRAFHAGFVGEIWLADLQVRSQQAEIEIHVLFYQATTASTRHPMTCLEPHLNRVTKN